MKFIKPHFEILTEIDGAKILKEIERVARTCYKSEDKITEDDSSARNLVQRLLNRGHLAMIEFGQDVIVKFIVDRGISHEIVRHRLASYAQESTRYVSSIDKKQFNIQSEEDVIYYYQTGLTMKKISERSKGLYTEWDIYKILEKNNIKKRGHNRKGIINESFFKNINTPEKAYLLGLIQADGNLSSKSFSIIISQNQENMWYIEKLIQNYIHNTAKAWLEKRNNKGMGIAIRNETLYNDLLNKGIVPRKSFENTKEQMELLWNSIPKKYKGDFLRGLLDGDGSIRFFYQGQNKDSHACRINWLGNKYLLKYLQNWLKENFNYETKIHKIKDSKKLYSLYITKYSIGLDVIKILYKNFVFPYGNPKKTSRAYEAIPFDYKIDTWGDENFKIIKPFWFNDVLNVSMWVFYKALYDAEEAYTKLIELGASPQEARIVLPFALKTEINVKMNLREWRHFFSLRCSPAAHPQMREVAIPLLHEFQKRIPLIFDDLNF